MSESQAIQMQEEANKIMSEIESQKLDSNGVASFIYSFFIIIAISMIFEGFVRSYKESKWKKKKNEEPTEEFTKKLWIVYGIHLIALILMYVICTYLVGITTPYVIFLLCVSIYIVEIAPKFTLHFNFDKKEEK